jgi:predicted RNA-binding protein with PUA-like domain
LRHEAGYSTRFFFLRYIAGMNYWLFKSEPHEFSFDDLLKRAEQTEPWTGIRNYQARNFIRDGMKPGDKVLFYHSSTAVLAVVGIAEIVKESYTDPTQFDEKSDYFDEGSSPENPRWLAVDVKAVKKLKNVVTLGQIKKEPELQKMRLVQRGNRLSVMPVTKNEFETILELSEADHPNPPNPPLGRGAKSLVRKL